MKAKILSPVLTLLVSQACFAGDAYQCPATSPIDAQHNRSGWYVGHYTPQTGSYVGAVGSTQTLSIKADSLVDTASAPHVWSQQANGDAGARLATGSVTISAPQADNLSSNLTGLNTVAPPWKSGAGTTEWPPATQQGALHAVIIQRNHMTAGAGSARRSHALSFAARYMEYRIAGSTDNVFDGISTGQLQLGGETLDVEIVTEYLVPGGWGDNDYCWRLFNNNNGFKGFEVQLRPIVHVLGRNLSLINNIPDIAGDYTGTIELSYGDISNSRYNY